MSKERPKFAIQLRRDARATAATRREAIKELTEGLPEIIQAELSSVPADQRDRMREAAKLFAAGEWPSWAKPLENLLEEIGKDYPDWEYFQPNAFFGTYLVERLRWAILLEPHAANPLGASERRYVKEDRFLKASKYSKSDLESRVSIPDSAQFAIAPPVHPLVPPIPADPETIKAIGSWVLSTITTYLADKALDKVIAAFRRKTPSDDRPKASPRVTPQSSQSTQEERRPSTSRNSRPPRPVHYTSKRRGSARKRTPASKRVNRVNSSGGGQS